MSKRLPIIFSAAVIVLIGAIVWLVVVGQQSPVTLMPDTTGSDVDAVGTQLSGLGYRVIVHRPAVVASGSGESFEKSYTIPAETRPFTPGQWTHLIADQQPAAGLPLQPTSEVVLVAGVHHGAGPFRPWLETHAEAVRMRGSQRCPACHESQFCGDCHRAVGADVE